MTTRSDKQRLDDALTAYRDVMLGARENQQVYAKRWRHYEKVKLGDTSRRDRPVREEEMWRSRLRFMFAHQQLKTLEPRLIRGELTSTCVPVLRAGMDAEAIKAANEAAANQQSVIEEQAFWDRFAEKEAHLVIHLAEIGCYWTKTLWDDQTVLYREWSDELQQMVDVTRNAPSTQIIHPGFIFADPAATMLDEADFITHRSYPSPRDLQALAKLKDENGKPLYTGLDALPTPGSSEGVGDWLASESETPEERKARRAGKYVKDEMWDFRTGMIHVVINGTTVIRSSPIPFTHLRNPFVNFVTQLDPTSLYGVSELAPLDHIQEEYQTVQNLLVDGIKLRVNPPLAVRMGSGAEDYLGVPGVKYDIDGDPSTALRPMQHDLDLSMARELLDKLKSEGEYVTGINEAMAGTANASTATQTQSNDANSGNRVNLRCAFLDRSWSRVFENKLLLNRQRAAVDAVMASRDGRVLDASQAAFAVPVRVMPEAMSAKQAMDQKVNTAQLVLTSLMPANGAPVFKDGSTLVLEPAVQMLADAVKLPIEAFKGAPPQPQVPPGMPPMPAQGDPSQMPPPDAQMQQPGVAA